FWGQSLGQVLADRAIRIQFNGLPESGDGPVRVARAMEGSPQHRVGLVTSGADGHCCPKVTGGLLWAFLIPKATKQVIDPEIPWIALLGPAQQRQRVVPVGVREQGSAQAGEDNGRLGQS